ncbi:MAG: SUMF1/EgtB/PvdO family nonheme iron enzyme [Pirellulaceae bacterium]
MAVVIGVDDYTDDKISDLEVAVKDALRLGAVLKNDCRFDVVHEIYDNHPQPSNRPLLSNIQKIIRSTLLDCGPEDTVVIFFSGHGFVNGDVSFLAPQDCLGKKAALSGYRTKNLIEDLEECEARQKILILDCCHAGGAGAKDAEAKIAKAFEAVPKLVTLASCEANQESQQWIAMGQSVFTFHLLRGLEGAADRNGDGDVDTQELHGYLGPRVQETAKSMNLGAQRPVKFPKQEPHPLVIARPRGFKTVHDMQLIRIAEGTFTMGSPADEEGNPDEKQRVEKISNSFYMGQTEVTQRQFAAVMGRNPSRFLSVGEDKETREAENRPVESVSFEDAKAFCDNLSQSPQEKEAGRVYRLPTEAEWEYACRAGTKTAVHFGNSLTSHQANFDGNFPLGQAVAGPDRNSTIPVGTFGANDWGLKDMHGNVWEWCDTLLDAEEGQNDRVIRGGGWDDNGYACRSAFRGGYVPERGRKDIGFRVVCEFR